MNKDGATETTVREAINQLASEGLLERRPRQGMFVRQPDRRELEELYDLRILLESYAAGAVADVAAATGTATAAKGGEEECACDGAVGEPLARACGEMDRIIEEFRASGRQTLEGDLAIRWFSAESAFHISILEAAGNRHVRKVASELRLMTRIMGRHRLDHTLGDLTRIQSEHARILKAILEGDSEGAAALMRSHVRRSKEDMIAGFAQQERQPPAAGAPSRPRWPDTLRQAIYRLESERINKPRT
ncbi:MAG: GntR family transcriptional regulator [bacterium]|nr:GntR family transcriptional regulator [bacterium]